MNQAILARQEFNESAEIFDRNHFAAVDLAYLGFGRHPVDGVAGNLHAILGNREDVYGTVILDVDLATGFFHQLFDILSARPNEGADLLRIDLDSLDARGVLAEFFAWGSERLGHLG